MSARSPAGTDSPIVLYDGDCGLCARVVQFVLRHERNQTIRFASLQSPRGQSLLRQLGLNVTDLSTFHFVRLPSSAPRAFSRSSGALRMLMAMGGLWPLAGALLWLVPKPLRDFGYNFIAKRRLQLFGRADACMLVGAEARSRFLHN